jgi:hypothetical protein
MYFIVLLFLAGPAAQPCVLYSRRPDARSTPSDVNQAIFVTAYRLSQQVTTPQYAVRALCTVRLRDLPFHPTTVAPESGR